MLNRNIFNNSFYSILSEIFSSLYLLAFRTVSLYYFASEVVGLKDYIWSLINVFNFFEAGISTVIIYYLYKPVDDKDYLKQAQYLSLIRNIYKYLSLIYIFIYFFIFIYVINKFPDMNVEVLYFTLILSLTHLVNFYFSQKKVLFIAYRKQYVFHRLNVITQFFSIILCFAFVNFIDNYIYLLVIEFFRVLFFSILLSHYFKTFIAFGLIYHSFNFNCFKVLYSDFKYSAIGSIAGVVYSSLIIVMISRYLELNAIASFVSFILISELLKKLCTSLFSITNSYLGVYYKRALSNSDDMNVFSEFCYKVIYFWGYIISITIIGFYFISSDFYSLWLQSSFPIEHVYVSILTIDLFLVLSQSFYGSLLISSGMFKLSQRSDMIGVFSFLVFSFILSYFFGLIGVFISILISRFLQFCSKLYYVNNEFAFFNYTLFIKYLLSQILIFLFIFNLNKYFLLFSNVNSIFSFVFSFFMILFLVMFFYLSLNFNNTFQRKFFNFKRFYNGMF